jgi:hypothetical protein
MSDFTAAGYLSDLLRTQGQYRTGEETNLLAQKEMPGAVGYVELTISGGAITPSVGRQSFTVDTEGDAGVDDLDKLTATNVHDGGIAFLRAENTARVVTVRSAQGGAGQIFLDNNEPFVMDSSTKLIAVQYRANLTAWYEVFRIDVAKYSRLAGYAEETTLTLSGDICTPTQFLHELDCETGTADNWRAIASACKTNLLLIHTKDIGDTITGQHNNVGTGDELFFVGGVDVVLDSPDKFLLMMRKTSSNAWEEVARFGFNDDYIFSGGRLSGSSTLPVPGDLTGISTLYHLAFEGNYCSFYKNSVWIPAKIGSASIAPPNVKYCPFFAHGYLDSSNAEVLELQRWDGGSQVTGSITGVSIAAAAVITSNSHPLQVGDIVCIDSITGTVGTDAKAGLNSRTNDVRQFTVTAIAANTFTIDAITTGLAYTSGGTWYKVPAAPALGRQDGVDVKSGDATRRLIGGGMTGFTAGQCDQTQICAHVVSHLNPLYAPGQLSDGTNTPQSSSNSHTYNSTTARPFDNDHSKRVRWLTLTGRTEVKLFGYVSGVNGASTYGAPSISLNRTDGSFFASGDVYDFASSAPMRLPMSMIASSPPGSNFACVQEKCTAASNVTFASFTLSMSIPR